MGEEDDVIDGVKHSCEVKKNEDVEMSEGSH